MLTHTIIKETLIRKKNWLDQRENFKFAIPLKIMYKNIKSNDYLLSDILNILEQKMLSRTVTKEILSRKRNWLDRKRKTLNSQFCFSSGT